MKKNWCFELALLMTGISFVMAASSSPGAGPSSGGGRPRGLLVKRPVLVSSTFINLTLFLAFRGGFELSIFHSIC